MPLRLFLPSLLTALLLALPARAGMDVPLAEVGRDLAAKHCGTCHATLPGTLSPNAAAPPFTEIAKLYPPETLEEALAEGIMVGHEAMPAFEFSADQVDQLIAYLQSLE
jgi:mono/diheme cytochrome c family protein